MKPGSHHLRHPHHLWAIAAPLMSKYIYNHTHLAASEQLLRPSRRLRIGDIPQMRHWFSFIALALLSLMALPSAASAAVHVTGPAYSGSTLTCSVDAGPAALLEWSREDSVIVSPEPAPASYTITQADVGHNVRCRAHQEQGATVSYSFSPYTALIAAGPPPTIPPDTSTPDDTSPQPLPVVIPDLPMPEPVPEPAPNTLAADDPSYGTITGQPAVKQTLTCHPGPIRGRAVLTYSWIRDGARTKVHSSRYTLSASDTGSILTCLVTIVGPHSISVPMLGYSAGPVRKQLRAYHMPALNAAGSMIAARRCTITGTAGPDRLVGTPGPDVICGRGGADRIAGLGGNDIIDAGAGSDIVHGGGGGDIVYGGPGRDKLWGDVGSDRISGGADADTIDAGAGSDFVHGGSAGDTIYGGLGADLLRGASGADRIVGAAGDDLITGGGGSDTILGGDGRDGAWANYGIENIAMGPGDDTVNTGTGRALVHAGPGQDLIVADRAGHGAHTLWGDAGTDRFVIWAARSIVHAVQGEQIAAVSAAFVS